MQSGARLCAATNGHELSEIVKVGALPGALALTIQEKQ